MAKDYWQLRSELKEAKRKRVTQKQGLPSWAKVAATGLLASINSDGNSAGANDDPKIRDKKLANQITKTAAIATLGIAVNSRDKTLLSKARSLAKKK
jgi:hypothetical protein